MRIQRATKVPLKFDDSVHSINNTKTNKRRNASKNKGKGTYNKSVDCGDNKKEGDSDTLGNTIEKMDPMDNKGCDGIRVDVVNTDDGVKSDGTRDQAMSVSLIDNDRKLECIPIEFDENGIEVVVFDEVMVAEGIKRWDMTFALASRIGKPLVMDAVTVSKCRQGIGMVRYARVLVEVNAKKELANDIEIMYKNNECNVHCKKNVKVFEKENAAAYKGNNDTHKEVNDGFVEVRSRKNVEIDNKVRRKNYRANPHNNKFGNNVRNVYQAKNNIHVEKEKTPVKSSEKSLSVKGDSTSGQ
ncbi:hypothetical protein Tco_0608954 [Tanacetum coccineum]